MEKAKAFFLVCAGIFLLVLSTQLGTIDALADSAGGSAHLIDFLQDIGNGKIWVLSDTGEIWELDTFNEWSYRSTWPGGTAVENTNWSQLKGSYGK